MITFCHMLCRSGSEPAGRTEYPPERRDRSRNFHSRQSGRGLGTVRNLQPLRLSGQERLFVLSARGFSFRTDSWARTIVDFYRATPGAGVIGFFGYALKTRSPSLSGGLKRYVRASLYRHAGGRVVRTENRAGEADFSPVVQVDGQCLIVPKSVWREHPFDEELFRDFHLYDVDSCVCIARRYANYICHSVFGEHGSVGSYDDDRYRNVLLFQRRWDGCLPLTVVPMSPREVRETETFAAYKFYKRVLSEGRSAYVPFARSMYRRYRTGRADLRLLRHALHYALILCLRRLRHG